MLVDATLAKVGVMEYAAEPHRQYNPPEVLERAAADVAAVPVTHLHPKKFVSADNYQALACGHVVGTPAFKDGHIHATLAIQDAKLMHAIEIGACREVSMGYYSDLGQGGVTADGLSYDAARTAITWNHIAIVPAGRAGASVRLMLDSSEEIPTEDEVTVTYTIDGAEVSADNLQAALDALVAQRDAAKADADANKARADKAEADLTTATSAEAVDAAVKAELARREDERKAAERKDAVAKRYPTLSLADKSAAYIDGLFDALQAEKAADPEGLNALKGAKGTDAKPAQTTDARPAPEKVDPRKAMLERNRKLASAPVGE
jgi:hypothetical protein